MRTITLDELAREPITCQTKDHFPERIYYWEDLGAYCGHCAVCGTDYMTKVPKEMHTYKGVPLGLL